MFLCQVILIEPYFIPFEPTVRAAGGVPVFIPLKPVSQLAAKSCRFVGVVNLHVKQM